MIVDIDIREIEVTIIENHEDAVVIIELTEVTSMIIVVQSFDVRIEPHLPSTEGAMTMTLQ